MNINFAIQYTSIHPLKIFTFLSFQTNFVPKINLVSVHYESDLESTMSLT